MLPQSGVGGCVPRPRKLRPAVSMIAVPTLSVACTMIGARTLGRTCCHMTRRSRAPTARAPYDAAEDVAAELVGPHQMCRAGRLALDAEVLVYRVVGAHLPREDREQREEHEEARSEHPCARAQEASPRRGPLRRRGAAAAVEGRPDRGRARPGHLSCTGCEDRASRTRDRRRG